MILMHHNKPFLSLKTSLFQVYGNIEIVEGSDIHPKYIRVENNSICWKNIAPCINHDQNVTIFGLKFRLKYDRYVELEKK